MRHAFPRRLALAALALAGTACVDYHPVVVTSFQPLKLEATGCSADEASKGLIRGDLDSNLGTGYAVGLRVENLLGSDADQNRTNTNYAYVESVAVSYRAGAGASFAAPAPQTTSVAVVVTAGGNSTFPALLLTKDNGASLAGQTGELLADITLNGHLADGSSFSTPKVTFPVGICTDCITACAAPTKAVACSADTTGQPDGFTCE